MGTPVNQTDSHHLDNTRSINIINPFQDMDLDGWRLNPPPTKKWVKFQDYDEEALLYKTIDRRRSTNDIFTLSSSLSSESSFGSTGEGGKSYSRLSNPCLEEEKKDFIFNSSFGGYKQNGDAATLRTMFEPPSRKSSLLQRVPTGSSFCSDDSISPLWSPNVKLKFVAFDEVRSQEKRSAEINFDEMSKYSAFDEIRRSGVVGSGWSTDLIGEISSGLREEIKVNFTLL